MNQPRCAFNRRRGSAVVEATMLAPWIYFVFVGALDMGMYLHAMIATQNAARVAAEYTSKSALTADDSAAACRYALEELQAMPNVRSLAGCGGAPLRVQAAAVTGVDGQPASAVSVSYRTAQLIPIPGLPGQLNITRTVQMKLR